MVLRAWSLVVLPPAGSGLRQATVGTAMRTEDTTRRAQEVFFVNVVSSHSFKVDLGAIMIRMCTDVRTITRCCSSS